MSLDDAAPPDLAAMEAARETLGDLIDETPVHRLRAAAVRHALGRESDVFLKLELFQRTGTFKARGALLSAMALDDAARARGVTAVSAGNHAIAVAFAADSVGTTAKVVMMEGADPFRVAQVRRYGADLVLVPDVHAAFETVRAIEGEEGRTMIHPFEGRTIACGTATVGLELARQVPALDAVIVPIGGGGLCAGVSCAIKAVQPGCRVYGVEPEGADTMHRSFAAGAPQPIERVRTIADSLGAPFALPYSFGLCRRYVDELVRIDDEAMRRAMGLLFAETKLAVEPAGAAATAALLGPLAARLRGKRTAVIVCGTNIDAQKFMAQAVFA
ncbi:MAG: threonine/serine dehydratase [Rhodospirillales bacterium]|nr:threonine/serine dehydratase [Rhodospirillales bacterium]MDE0381509.1 threonine/serine dehydratase [Rhodospirillales bacterium]